MNRESESVVKRFALKAIVLGADALEIEHRDGYVEVLAMKGNIGQDIARLPSASHEAAMLCVELHAITQRRRHLTVGNEEYELRCRVQESFGEDEFRIDLARVQPRAAADQSNRMS